MWTSEASAEVPEAPRGTCKKGGGRGTEAEPGLARQCQGEQSPENLRLTVNTKGRWAQGRILFFLKLIAQGQGLRAMWGKVDRWTESTGLLCLSVGVISSCTDPVWMGESKQRIVEQTFGDQLCRLDKIK